MHAGLNITGLARIEDVAFHRITKVIIEDGPPLTTLNAFVREHDRRGSAGPGLAINQNIRVDRSQLFDDQHDRIAVHQSDQVEAKTVDLVFVDPVFERVQDIPADHRSFRSKLIARTRTVPVTAVLLQSVIITGHEPFEAEDQIVKNRFEGVVKDDIQRDSDALPVQRIDHALDL